MADNKTGIFALFGFGAIGAGVLKVLSAVGKLGAGAKIASVGGSAALVTHGDDVFRLMARMGPGADDLGGISRGGALISHGDDGALAIRLDRAAPQLDLAAAKAANLDRSILSNPHFIALSDEAAAPAGKLDELAPTAAAQGDDAGLDLLLHTVRLSADVGRLTTQVLDKDGRVTCEFANDAWSETDRTEDAKSTCRRQLVAFKQSQEARRRVNAIRASLKERAAGWSFTTTAAIQAALSKEQISSDCLITARISSDPPRAVEQEVICTHSPYNAAVAADFEKARFEPRFDETGAPQDYVLQSRQVNLIWEPPAPVSPTSNATPDPTPMAQDQ